jgi:hypothetical protein
MRRLPKKWYIWQFIFISLIIFSFYKDWKVATIIFGAFELLVLYGTFRKKEQNQYCLPAPLARGMKKVPLEVQYESSILGTFLILIGLIASGIYSVFFLQMDWWFKGLIVFNVISAMILLSSQLTTTYQQYNSYKQTKEFMANVQSSAFINKEKQHVLEKK